MSVTVKREFAEEAGALADEAERAHFTALVDQLFANGKQVRSSPSSPPAARGSRPSPRVPQPAGMRACCLVGGRWPSQWRRLHAACVVDRFELDVDVGTHEMRRPCTSSRVHLRPLPCALTPAAPTIHSNPPLPGTTQVYRGYVDDPRATDNAWMETTAFHFHCSAEVGDRLPLAAGDDAGQVSRHCYPSAAAGGTPQPCRLPLRRPAQVMWLDVRTDSATYQNLYGAHRALIDEAIMGESSRAVLNPHHVALTPAPALALASSSPSPSPSP